MGGPKGGGKKKKGGGGGGGGAEKGAVTQGDEYWSQWVTDARNLADEPTAKCSSAQVNGHQDSLCRHSIQQDAETLSHTVHAQERKTSQKTVGVEEGWVRRSLAGMTCLQFIFALKSCINFRNNYQ